MVLKMVWVYPVSIRKRKDGIHDEKQIERSVNDIATEFLPDSYTNPNRFPQGFQYASDYLRGKRAGNAE